MKLDGDIYLFGGSLYLRYLKEVIGEMDIYNYLRQGYRPVLIDEQTIEWHLPQDAKIDHQMVDAKQKCSTTIRHNRPIAVIIDEEIVEWHHC